MRLLPIAALQTSPVFGDPNATVRRMAEQVARVREVMPRVRLVMFPELHLAALPPVLNPQPTLKGSDPLRVDVPGPLTWMGAEVVLQVSLTTTSDRPQELVLARANAIFNQLYVVSLNAGSPAGLGRSLIVDPEGLVRLQAGDGEELLTDVLDLDAVTRVREHGTAGVSRLWEQTVRSAPALGLQPTRDGERSG